ncbi:TetR/AcrR family transcriptional regulator [Rhizobium rhizogenes]|uniref:TetR/AcrR family transcriptional regulator n=1 Tax=Rhizobium rhizogenes TaxID=359 RepID=UPI0004D39825|nr:TetR/AcrR family transcriptional regulator [Rhizobium rhizogenes]KEA04044.1 TetR family transcriptional regulator [Rhizobium rhizogenes]MQB31895.1 TetR/AcrR family transcriptional regulator [Rhizobium rhizogenes]NTI82365.1 TetR/AcrR family transcriptional regulator [Rhizobium rhizogenes]NTJ24547.1 TetR/AcrR family transcriptional regulator [Rhizobium rhizogenes]QUE79577.1 TetR/AcrR family transcriptional regulator [Rhizobium rhizogenes]
MTRTVFEKSDAIALVAEVFRELGYEGASMSSITARTKLSKGSLYHFFPGGKEEMAAQIMANIDAWFVTQMFRPLEEDEPRAAITLMWETTNTYFRSGRRVCLIGAFALDETRDRFSSAIQGYFKRWIKALAGALMRAGVGAAEARELAEEAVVGIQGALTLARALGDDSIFGRTLGRLRERLMEPLGRRGP